MVVVLFDIDGTLLDMRGAGRRSFVRALDAVFGWQDDIAYVNFSGNTDLNVLQEVARAHGHALSDGDCSRFFQRLPVELEQLAVHAELILYPGVRSLLESLSSRDDVVLGLVTGNIEACARIKLRRFDLHGHFVLGAFGDDHADRNEIARLALGRIRAALPSGSDIRRVALIGDTPFDVAAARSIGATSIAVATGKFGAEELRAAGADYALATLADTPRVLSMLGLF